jgi:hypothetical protein
MSQENSFLPHLGSALLRGLSIGMAVKAGTTGDDADSLAAGRLPQEVGDDLTALLGGESTMMPLVQELDALVARHAVLAPFGEYLFDLVMLKIIQDGTDREGDDFLDSGEMIELEDKTLDRGTELLNLIVYLRDCRQNEMEPNLTDFLNEFLLIEEEDFEDEFFIYEDVIRHQGIVKESLAAVVAAGETVEADELAEVFTPMMVFFNDTLPKKDSTLVQLARASHHPERDAALYSLLLRFQSL